MNELQLSPDEKKNVLKRKSSNMSDPKIYESNVSLKRCKYNKTNISKKNLVLKDTTSKIKNVKILQKSPLKKIVKQQVLWADAKKLLREK